MDPPGSIASTNAASSTIAITACTTATDMDTAAQLFRAYVAWLDLDLSFQDFETELASLPGKYAASQSGCLLLARDANSCDVLGVVGVRRLPSAVLPKQSPTASDVPGSRSVCEMKRLYVTPAGRGRGVGRALAEAVILKAQWLGYESMVLDSLLSMEAARALYKKLGFVVCAPYYDTPIEGTVFLQKALQQKPP